MYVCYSRSKNESHAKAVLYHLENWGFTMPEEDGEKNIMREVTYEQECESIARHQEAVVDVYKRQLQGIPRFGDFSTKRILQGIPCFSDFGTEGTLQRIPRFGDFSTKRILHIFQHTRYFP